MQSWQIIGQTLAAEFSDIPTLADLTRITLRLLVAGALGGLLGYERERKGKSAGLRTHMLVAIGAALFVLISLQAGADSESDALSRVLQGIVVHRDRHLDVDGHLFRRLDEQRDVAADQRSLGEDRHRCA